MVDVSGEIDRGADAALAQQPIQAVFQAMCTVPVGAECIVDSPGPTEYRDQMEAHFACNQKRAKILSESNGWCEVEMLEGDLKGKTTFIRAKILRLSGNFISDSTGASRTHALLSISNEQKTMQS